MADWELRLGRYQDVLADVESVDAVIMDPPYSVRTHSGHGRIAGDALDSPRTDLGYPSWGPPDIAECVQVLGPRCRGWWVVITDDVLAPIWRRVLDESGRYAFAPLPWVVPGARPRFLGDGPASWTCWIVVARPRTQAYARWGSLPGAYIQPGGLHTSDREHRMTGGKSLWLMRSLIRDYTRPGDLVCDPTAGAGTTLLAAVTERRRAVGAELDPDTHALAAGRLIAGYTPVWTE